MTERRSGPRSLVTVALFLAGAASFVAIIYLLGIDKVDTILETDLRFAAAAFGAGLAVTMTTALRWSTITGALAGRRALTYPQHYASLVTGRLVGLFVPRSGGELGIRFISLTGLGKTSAEVAAASVALDRLFDLTLLMAWLPVALLVLSSAVPAETGAVLLPVATGVALLAMFRLNLVVRWVARGLSQVMARIGGPPILRRFSKARVRNLEELAEVEHLPSRQTLILAGMTVTRYVLSVALMYFVAEALGLGISFYTYLLAGTLMQLTLLWGFTPGGLGIFDAGAVYALALGGVSSDDVAVFLVGQRAFQYTFFPVVAGISYLALLRPGRVQAGNAAAETALPAGGDSANTP